MSTSAHVPISALKALMAARRLRAVDVAAISGLSIYHVYQLLGYRGGQRGEPMTGMKVGVLLRLAYALGVAPTEICPGLAWRPPKPARLGHDAVVAALRGRALVLSDTENGPEVVGAA